ncbi:MAG: hypothetical protein MRY21_08475 [Simkaniaceae bacterium]|nr:hypothetical protein [Simkaniaceae bacterium]
MDVSITPNKDFLLRPPIFDGLVGFLTLQERGNLPVALGKGGQDAFTSEYTTALAFYQKIKGDDKTEEDFKKVIADIGAPTSVVSGKYETPIQRVYQSLQVEALIKDLGINIEEIGLNFKEDHKILRASGMSQPQALHFLTLYYKSVNNLYATSAGFVFEVNYTDDPVINRAIDKLIQGTISRYITEKMPLEKVNLLLASSDGTYDIVQPDCIEVVDKRRQGFEELQKMNPGARKPIVINSEGIATFSVNSSEDFESVFTCLIAKAKTSPRGVETIIHALGNFVKQSGVRDAKVGKLISALGQRLAHKPFFQCILARAKDLQLTKHEIIGASSIYFGCDLSPLLMHAQRFASLDYSLSEAKRDSASLSSASADSSSSARHRIDLLCENLQIEKETLPMFFTNLEKLFTFAKEFPMLAVEHFPGSLAIALLNSIDISNEASEYKGFISALLRAGSINLKLAYIKKESERSTSYFGQSQFKPETEVAIKEMSPDEFAELYKCFNPSASSFIDLIDTKEREVFAQYAKDSIFNQSKIKDLGHVVEIVYATKNEKLFDALNKYMHWHIGFDKFLQYLGLIVQDTSPSKDCSYIFAERGEPFPAMVSRNLGGRDNRPMAFANNEHYLMELEDERLPLHREETYRAQIEREQMQKEDPSFVPDPSFISFDDSDFEDE